jgi:uncharacterized membrane protein YfcA
MVPLSLFIGIAASAIGFTAWPLIVPILFALFGFNLYLTILTSLLVDCGNALVITLTALRHQQIDVKKGLLLSCFAAIWIVAGIALGKTFIPNNEDLFRGSAGIVAIIIGILFLLKGFKTGRQEKKLPESGNQLAGLNQDAGTATSSKSSTNKSSGLKPFLIYPGVAFMAFQVGLVGIGGGMGYAIFLMLFLAFPIVKATGTAMLMTFCSTILAACGIFFQIPESVFLRPAIKELILLIVILSMIGTWVGAKIAYSLSEQKVNYLIGSIVIIAGVIATIQKYIIQFMT